MPDDVLTVRTLLRARHVRCMLIRSLRLVDRPFDLYNTCAGRDGEPAEHANVIDAMP
jgi:hypothetical protein